MKWVNKVTEIDKARFWSKCKYSGYCWEWSANKDSNGYGMFRIQGVYTKASRIAYQLINGEIDSDRHVLHKCDNPSCINPDHLFTGTHQDNMLDRMRKGRGKHLGRTSKYHGVSFRNDSNRWRSFVKVDGKIKQLGCYKSEVDAAKRRDEEVVKQKLDLPLNFEI